MGVMSTDRLLPRCSAADDAQAAFPRSPTRRTGVRPVSFLSVSGVRNRRLPEHALHRA